jgi:hypothetical protein
LQQQHSVNDDKQNRLRGIEDYMTITVEWLIEGKVLLCTSDANLTIEDMATTDKVIYDYLQQATRPIHQVLDGRQTQIFPLHVRTMVDAIPNWKHPNAGWFVIINEKRDAGQFLTSLTAQVIGVRFRFVASVEEALVFLKKADPTLDH